ncbi:hypothetical protein SBA4_5690003 [Candidatus Sulfopaludibacter sp. SbA4]|nr:hypothetical protein SBA4_5690003 [Candidatus Sulfopaludibacter sp. SbA4]
MGFLSSEVYHVHRVMNQTEATIATVYKKDHHPIHIVPGKL